MSDAASNPWASEWTVLTMSSREVPILGSDIVEGSSCWIEDLDITSHIFLSPDLAEIVEAGIDN